LPLSPFSGCLLRERRRIEYAATIFSKEQIMPATAKDAVTVRSILNPSPVRLNRVPGWFRQRQFVPVSGQHFPSSHLPAKEQVGLERCIMQFHEYTTLRNAVAQKGKSPEYRRHARGMKPQDYRDFVLNYAKKELGPKWVKDC
jgi:hypothetical protein